MKTHDLKTHPQFWEQVLLGTKSFELRRNDRDFKVNDFVRLNRFDPSFGFTGETQSYAITYILLPEDCPGLLPGFCILGLGTVVEE